MKKVVNIESKDILYVLSPPLSGVINKVTLDVADIRYCLNRGASVKEILKDGSLLDLDLNNFDKDNNVKKEEKQIEVKEEIRVEDSIKIEPVIEEEPKVEEVVEVQPEEEVKEEVVEEKVEEPQQHTKNNSQKKKRY